MLTAHVSADRAVVRLEEPLNFSSEGTLGDIKTYLWDFGDGNTSTTSDASHTYGWPGLYNVTLTVFDSDDQTDSATLRVGVQLPDIHDVHEKDREVELRPRIMTGTGASGAIGPNIGDPAVEVRIQVVRPVGTFELKVEIRYLVEGQSDVTIETRSISATGTDINLSLNISPEDIPDDVCIYEALIIGEVVIDQGTYSSMRVTIDGIFPTEGIEDL